MSTSNGAEASSPPQSPSVSCFGLTGALTDRTRNFILDGARYDRAMPARHFPPPWSVEELDSCFGVKDANGQALAYMYFEKKPLRRFRRRELLTRDEAQRIAAIFAKLPDLLMRS